MRYRILYWHGVWGIVHSFLDNCLLFLLNTCLYLLRVLYFIDDCPQNTDGDRSTSPLRLLRGYGTHKDQICLFRLETVGDRPVGAGPQI